jgi:hypothetical protein
MRRGKTTTSRSSDTNQFSSGFGAAMKSMKEIAPKHVYRCPVFATTNRLSKGGVGAENKALFYVDLPSVFDPRKWVKRSVALLMQP